MNASPQARTDQVRAALAQVTDPELDESVIDLGFVTGIAIADDGAVDVAFRLPTYWCAANFSYLMAADMRDAVAALPWVTSAGVSLDEHMFIDEINGGIAANKDFTEAFPTEAGPTGAGPTETGNDLAAIRLQFGLKAMERRQEALLRHLLQANHDPETFLALDIESLQALPLDADGEKLRTRYLERRNLAGGLPRAFVTAKGEPIMHETLKIYLRHVSRVGLNAEFNGALCRGLLAARYAPLPPNPELADFMRQAR